MFLEERMIDMTIFGRNPKKINPTYVSYELKLW